MRIALEPSAHLLKILVCPLTKQPFLYVPGKREVYSIEARVAYPILEDGTLNLNPLDGRVMDDNEFGQLH
jgi:hypothetical protein